MKKISKNTAAANDIAADVATSILTNLGAAPAAAAPAVEKPAKVAKMAKPAAKVKAKAKTATKTVAEQVDASGIRVTVREVAVLKAVAGSEFADENGAVPSVALASSVTVEAKGNSPIPGLIASLNKKGLVVTSRAKGQTLVRLTEVGVGFAEAAE